MTGEEIDFYLGDQILQSRCKIFLLCVFIKEQANTGWDTRQGQHQGRGGGEGMTPLEHPILEKKI